MPEANTQNSQSQNPTPAAQPHVPVHTAENADDYLSTINQITQRLERGRAARTAAGHVGHNAQVIEPASAVVVTKETDADGAAPLQKAAQARQGMLQKQFLGLLQDNKLRKSLSFLEADDDALEFPEEFLRKKAPGINNELAYVVKDWQLEALTQCLLMKGNKEEFATPVHQWAEMGNAAALAEKVSDMARAGNPLGVALAKALDTSTGANLIRTDLEPVLYEAYRRRFPADELIPRVRSNGLVHTYNQITDPGAAVTTDELGTTIGSNFVNQTYARKTSTNIAVIISPRAIGLKLFYAVNQSGMSAFNLGMSDSNLEIRGAMRAIADKNQSLIFQGNQTDNSSAGISTEKGAYDANSFDGLRIQLKASGTAITKGNSQAFVDVFDQAVGAVVDEGGDSESVWLFMSQKVRRAINRELFPYSQLVNGGGGGPINNNLSNAGLMTVADWRARMVNVPGKAQGQGLGWYTFDPGSGNATYEDGYVLDPEGIQLAWLGSPTPQILELPTGTTLNLSTVYIPFLMNGLVVRVLPFNRKVRVPQQS